MHFVGPDDFPGWFDITRNPDGPWTTKVSMEIRAAGGSMDVETPFEKIWGGDRDGLWMGGRREAARRDGKGSGGSKFYRE